MTLDAEVIVVGAGHAGCEAALAAARCGASTVLITLNLDTVAAMPCNPSIGGQGKGQLVREIDALGGEMGLIADETNILARLLNTRKGLAVQSIRVQSDKYAYGKKMVASLLDCPRLDLVQGMVAELLVDRGEVKGVATASGDKYFSNIVILAPGTFLRGLIHIGKTQFPAGRAGEPPADELGTCLESLGLPILRFKTGTPPRIAKTSIRIQHLEIQEDDPSTPPFSLRSQNRNDLPRVPCFLTHTNEETHEIIKKHFHESALISGRIQGTGPRYCPSIEDKIRKFPQKNSHKVFLEPEGADSLEIYLQGLSTSLSENVQELYVRSIQGLEEAKISRPGYAIEYDIVDPTSLFPTLMSQKLKGLFFAGQVNGTSGYEEAAAQGMLAGINAALKARQKPPLILSPENSYLGLMVEEITFQGLVEPYRIFTSRTQNRLHLRMSNAEERLAHLAREVRVLDEERFQKIRERSAGIEEAIRFLEEGTASEEMIQALYANEPGKLTSEKVPLARLLKRPEVELRDMTRFIPSIQNLDPLAKIEVEARIKYEGYFIQQEKEAGMVKEFQNLSVTERFLNDLPVGLSTEAKQRILAVRPETLGKLSRIPGIRATDVILVLMHLRKQGPV